MKLEAEDLLQMGFVDFSTWSFTNVPGVLSYSLDSQAAESLNKSPNALYAFIQGSAVMYVGKTARGINKRFRGYCNPGSGKATNYKCHTKISEALARNETIAIYVFLPDNNFQYKGLPINIAAGLEDSLITACKPEWNGKVKMKPVSDEVKEEVEDELFAGIVPGDEVIDTDSSEKPLIHFTIELGETYWNKGYINPGVDVDSLLGGDGEVCLVYRGDRADPVNMRINRTANRNGTVRLLGDNRKIAEWFQENFQKGDTVGAEVLGRNEILLVLNA